MKTGEPFPQPPPIHSGVRRPCRPSDDALLLADALVDVAGVASHLPGPEVVNALESIAKSLARIADVIAPAE